MNVLDLALDIGLEPKKVASTKGGEYKSACPNCKEGKDRFCIWPQEGIAGRYWCRFCNVNGDAIQFCRDFLGLSYVEACKRTNIEPKQKVSLRGYCPFKKRAFSPQASASLPAIWEVAAQHFVESCQTTLLSNSRSLELLLDRGLNYEMIKAFHLGWNDHTLYECREAWGLPAEVKNNGKLRTQWLPKGIVIPTFEENRVIRLKVRRSDWFPEDELPKYVEISGSLKRPSVYGDLRKSIIVVESELDAILIQQFASDLCCCIALGGVSKRPDTQVHELLLKAPLILLALDYDEAGKKEFPFWMSIYPNLRPWPAPKGKSPGDAFKLGVNLRSWLSGVIYN